MIRMLVGLGNPGQEYEGTRHNAGFWWIDEAARVLGTRLMHDRAYHGLVARVNRPEGPVWLIEPQTYMNLSGKSVAPLARFFKIEATQILVVHDELDLPPGQMKIKQGGGVAGHNGLKDIQAQLGTADFWRLRIGIGHPGDRSEVANWVLPALNEVVHAGQREGYGLELIVDDQDFTHDWLREGAVLGCVSTVAEALRGCSVTALGTMRYIAVASPAFCATRLQAGLHRGNFAQVPWLVFNRKDDMHVLWVAKAFGIQSPRLVERYVPSSEAHVRAATMGWGVGVMPEQLAAPWLADGTLAALHAHVWVDVLLHWHQWKLRADDSPEPPLRAGVLDRIGRALIVGAGDSLRPAPG